MNLTRDEYEQFRLLEQDGDCPEETVALLRAAEASHPDWAEQMIELEQFERGLRASMDPPELSEFSRALILREAAQESTRRALPRWFAAVASLAILLASLFAFLPRTATHSDLAQEQSSVSDGPALSEAAPAFASLDELETEIRLLEDLEYSLALTLDEPADELEGWAAELLQETTI